MIGRRPRLDTARRGAQRGGRPQMARRSIKGARLATSCRPGRASLSHLTHLVPFDTPRGRPLVAAKFGARGLTGATRANDENLARWSASSLACSNLRFARQNSAGTLGRASYAERAD